MSRPRESRRARERTQGPRSQGRRISIRAKGPCRLHDNTDETAQPDATKHSGDSQTQTPSAVAVPFPELPCNDIVNERNDAVAAIAPLQDRRRLGDLVAAVRVEAFLPMSKARKRYEIWRRLRWAIEAHIRAIGSLRAVSPGVRRVAPALAVQAHAVQAALPIQFKQIRDGDSN